MRVFIAMATAAVLGFAWLALSNPADAQTRHVKHRPGRTTIHPYYPRYWPPGYNPGGPNYTTCDRINHDRMLVGTCR
jgi:hypothetical protein